MRESLKNISESNLFIALLTATLIISFLFSVKHNTASIKARKFAASQEQQPTLSAEAVQTKLQIKKRAKKVRAENPGVFIKAQSEIKTAPDGTSYSPNYKYVELNKAKARKLAVETSILQKSSVQTGHFENTSTSSVQRLSIRSTNTAGWVERGPGNVSGRARAIVMDPADPTHSSGFVATVGGGVWKFTNDGATWENKTPDLTTLTTTTIAMAASNPDVMYVGTGMGYGRVIDLAGSGIWKTIDHGETWNQLTSTANNELLPAINRIVVSPSDENIVLVCSNGDYTSFGPNGGSRESGIFRSIDGGTTWTQTFFPEDVFGPATDNRVQQIIANPDNFNTLYASVNEVGVIKSVDMGLTWTISADNFARAQDVGIGEGTYQGISTRTELAVSPTDSARVYAAVERRYGVSKLFMTKDAGATWIEVLDTGSDPNWFNSSATSGAVPGAYTAGWFDNTIAVHPFDENIVYVGGVEIYRIIVDLVDNTRTTTEIASTGQVHADHHWLEMVPTGASTFRIFNANDGGLAYSDNSGVNWTSVTGMGTTQFYGADKKAGVSAYVGGMQDNGTWFSGSDPSANSNWTRAFGGDGVEVAWNYADPNLMLLGYQNGNLYRSTDGGYSFAAMPEAKAGTAAPFISKIAHSKLDPDLVFTVGNAGVKRSDDFGKSWTLTPISGNWIGWRAFDNVEISVADPQVVWISSRMNYETWIGKQGGIHVSNDGGLTFTEISQNFPANLVEASGIGTHPSQPETAYMLFSAANGPKVMRTTDLGQTWVDISGFTPANSVSSNGFPNVAVYSLLVLPDNESTLWAGTEIGLFVSYDSGANWQLADNGLPNVGIFQMSVVDDEIIAATYGRGVWSAVDQLGAFTSPAVTLSPRLLNVGQSPQGNLVIDVNLRSPYDSTQVIQNGVSVLTIGATETSLDTSLSKIIVQDETVQVYALSYKDGRAYRSPEKTVEVSVSPAQYSYISDLSSLSAMDDFSSVGFSIKPVSGFSNPAIHSVHPYENSKDYIIQLKTPIIVQAENAVLSYQDVALIEEGYGTSHLDPNFYDFVIIEGTRDGVNWIPLKTGYDSRFYSVWLTAYRNGLDGWDSSTKGNESMYYTHTINLLEKFDAGEKIFIRYRLHADGLAIAWGWAIDSIKIQADALFTAGNTSGMPSQFALHQNFPNPFNPVTTISYDLPYDAAVSLIIYDIKGREVAVLANGDQRAGFHEMQWAGINGQGNSVSTGMYFCRIQAGDYSKTIKMSFLK